MDTLVRGPKLACRILRAPSMQKVIAEAIYPGPKENIPDAEPAQFVRQYAKTIYHPVGTCRMGNDDRTVADPQLRARGGRGLRVCDASVMPTICGGNANAPTIMIAERGAEFMPRRPGAS